MRPSASRPGRGLLAVLLIALAPLATGAQADPPVAADDAAAPVLRTSVGRISYYARKFDGRRTANGQRHDAEALTMAHRTLPFGTWVRVTNLRNQRSVVVRVNDRGPHIAGRIADLSAAAARQIGMSRRGVVTARLEVLGGVASDAAEPAR